MGSSTVAPKEIAILGGGVSALAAAFELSDPRHGGAFNVTIYQIGWRLGGKCATGRDMDPLFRYRIKEHGPHIFFGFYDNAFAILREAYSELPPKADRAYTSIEDALMPQCSFVTIEHIGGTWLPWVLTLPVMPGQPGDAPLSSVELLDRVLTWMQSGARQLATEPAPAALVSDGARAIATAIAAVKKGERAIATAIAASKTGAVRFLALPLVSGVLLQALKGVQTWLQDIWPLIGKFSTDGRRICILIDLAIATAIGALQDGLLVPTPPAVAAANEVEYGAWLTSHGAQPETVGSAVVRAMYDTVFAYPDGDVTKPPNVEAGSAVLVQRAMMGYRGHIFWKMGAGTGDVVAAPIFEVLRERGVKVKFFHRVDELVPSADNTRIAEVRIGRQATTPAPDYDPLIQVQVGALQLDAWPDRPRYELLDQGAALKAQCVDLESNWTEWVDPVSERVIRAKDAGENGQFDTIIVAMPPEALRLIAPATAPSTWSDMFDHIGSVQTCSLQLWLNCPVTADQCTTLASPTLCGFDACQLDTWFDASAVIKWEGRTGQAPAQLALLCGPMPTILTIPPRSDHGFPAAQEALALTLGEAFLAASGPLWPGLQSNGSFDMTRLFTPNNASPELRLSQQYWVAAINPSDRYVQTLVATSKFRCQSADTGYDNLFFCGDWTDYGFNFGCFEGAVISGLQAANAVTGNPRPILNDPFNWS